MSLFSKLFSRDDKVSEESASESAQAKTSDTRTDARKSNAASAEKPSAEATATEKKAVKTPNGPAGQGPAAEGQAGAGGAKDGTQAGAKPPPLEAAAGKGKKPGNKTLAYGRADKASPAQPPAAAAPPAPAGSPKATPAKPMPAAAPVAPAAAAAPAAKPAPTAAQPAAAAPTVAVQPAVVVQPIAAVPAAAPPAAAAAGGIPPLPSDERDSSADAIDAALDALERPQGRHSVPGLAADERALAETFAAVAQVHAQPLRELMFQLELGHTPSEWCSLARPVLRPLLEAAQQIGLLELVGALLAFDAALERAATEASATLSERATETLKTVYQSLCRQLPAVFIVTSEAGGPGRQTVLLESLLLQIPELHRRSLAKLYAAGLSSLAQLSQARADELVAVTGIDAALAERLIAHVHSFEEARTRVLPSDLKSRAHERLRGVVDRLRQLQDEFEQAERDEQSDKKRAARRGREAALHELDLVLAQIGEIAVIEELKRCPVQLKIQRVSTYLKEAQASA